MSRFLYRLGRGSAAHRKLVLVAWLLAIVALSGIGKAAGGAFYDTFSVPEQRYLDDRAARLGPPDPV